MRGQLCIGLHRDVEVTEAAGEKRPMVSQAFCSALPVAYTSIAPSHWKAFASLVLEGAYEATLCAAVHNAQRGASSIVLLTSLGGGAFGNDESWILARMSLRSSGLRLMGNDLINPAPAPRVQCVSQGHQSVFLRKSRDH